jgi:hypothetical protein
MKTALWFTIAVLCLAHGISAERPPRGRMKGMELYSWEVRGKWFFVLVDGTNRLKSEEEVKGSANRMETVGALSARFQELAEGEHVVWNLHFVPGFAFPEEKLLAEIVAAANRAEVKLIHDRR